MLSMSTAIHEYLEMCKYEKKLSANTVKAYCIDLCQFAEFTKGEWANRKRLFALLSTLLARFTPKISIGMTRSVHPSSGLFTALLFILEYDFALIEH